MARHRATWSPTVRQALHEFMASHYGAGFEVSHFKLVRRHVRQEWSS